MTGDVSFEPLVWWPVVAGGACLALAIVVASAVGAGRRGWSASARRAATVVLTAGVLLGPHVGTTSTTVTAQPEFEVVVALDRTASMAVRDAGATSRLEQAVADVDDLAAALDAPLAVVTWGGAVEQRVPATTDDAHLSGTLLAIAAEPPTSGSGSRIDRPIGTLRTLLSRSSAEHPDRVFVLVLLSDGENTAGGREGSFDALADDLSRALVIGYGTATGGPVPLGPNRPDAYVPGPDGTGPAVSRRDDTGLRDVARQLGGEYRNREDLPSASSATDLLQPPASAQSTIPAPADVTWLLALALLALLIPDLRLVTRQWREVRATRRSG